jgi:hypothetical protein
MARLPRWKWTLSALIIPVMVFLSKKKALDIVDLAGSGALETLKLAVPLAKTIPVFGGTLEGCITAALYIIQVKDVRLPPCSDRAF